MAHHHRMAPSPLQPCGNRCGTLCHYSQTCWAHLQQDLSQTKSDEVDIRCWCCLLRCRELMPYTLLDNPVFSLQKRWSTPYPLESTLPMDKFMSQRSHHCIFEVPFFNIQILIESWIHDCYLY